MKKYYISILALFFITTACDDDNLDPDQISKQDVVNTYADIVLATYSDAYNTANILNTKIDDLVANPSTETLQAAKDAWLAAREPYGQSEAFRFYGGPIDDEDGPEGQLNAWPLDESYIDYVNGNVNGSENNDGTNIIADAGNFPTIDKTLIAAQNEAGGETNVSSGYHAIEFLLWGQDNSTGAGGGDRSFTDFSAGNDCTNGNCDRRGDYIKAASALLLEDLQLLINEWQEGGSYRTAFTSESNLDNALEGILAGMGKLSKGELAGERMFVAWDEKSKEDEHSCFSDNTHRDIVTNNLGIYNVYVGKYVASDGVVTEGPGIDELVAQQNPTLDNELTSLFSASILATEAIEAPFDQEFLAEPGRTRIKSAIDLLRDQGDKIAEVSALFGYTLDPSDI